MSYLKRKEQKKKWKKKDWIPITDKVSLKIDTIIKPHDPEQSQKIGFHFNLQESLVSNQPKTYPTIPINVEHIEIPKIDLPSKPEKVSKDLTFFNTFNKTFNPLWSSEKDEDEEDKPFEAWNKYADFIKKKDEEEKVKPFEFKLPTYDFLGYKKEEKKSYDYIADFIKKKDEEEKVKPFEFKLPKYDTFPTLNKDRLDNSFGVHSFLDKHKPFVVPTKITNEQLKFPYLPLTEYSKPKLEIPSPSNISIGNAFSIAQKYSEINQHKPEEPYKPFFQMPNMPISDAFKIAEQLNKKQEEAKEEKNQQHIYYDDWWKRNSPLDIGVRGGLYGMRRIGGGMVRKGVYG